MNGARLDDPTLSGNILAHPATLCAGGIAPE
jgi:hypothetical protein